MCSSATSTVITFVMLAIARAGVRVLLREDGPVVADEIPGGGVDPRAGRRPGGLQRGLHRSRERGGEDDDGEQSPAHHRRDTLARSIAVPYHPAAFQTCAARLSASAAAATRQSSSPSRKA